MNKFEHGGNIKSFSKQLNCKKKDIIDLSSNINFITPKIKINFNNLDISSYPDYENLYKKVAQKYKVNKNNIELFNGGSSAIFSFFKNMNLKHCTIYSPAYLEYKKAANIFSYKLNLINRFENIYTKKIIKNSLVIFVNPSTPDGKYYDLKKLMKIWIKRNCTIFIDESFLDFTNKKSSIKYLKRYDKLYILKSMTKMYSSASIRVGTIISNAYNIEYLRSFEPLWKISHFDSIYLQNALKGKSFISKTVAITKSIKTYTIKKLNQISFVKNIYKSNSNYLLIQLKNIDSTSLQNLLIPYKIMIRDCSNFDFLDSSYVRIAIKDKKKMKTFLKSLKEIDKDKNSVS